MENMEFMKLTDAEELAMCCVWEIGGDVTLVQVIETITKRLIQNGKDRLFPHCYYI